MVRSDDRHAREAPQGGTVRRGRRLPPAPRRRRWRTAVALPVTAALLAGGLATWRYDLLDRAGAEAHARWPDQVPSWVPGAEEAGSTPAATPGAAAGADAETDATSGDTGSPTLPEPAPVLASAPQGALRPEAVRSLLRRVLGDRRLGRHVVGVVSDLDGTVVRVGPVGAALPASTTKLFTTSAALAALGPGTRFATTVRRAGDRVVLVGGGDPLLAREDVASLGREAATALRADGVRRVRVGWDASLFTGPAFDPSWPASYRAEGVVAPISALWVDGGRTASGYGRVSDPPREAALVLAAALRRAGVRVTGLAGPGVAAGAASGSGDELARHESQPVASLVEHTLQVSDNEAAEVLARQVGLAAAGDGSFAGGTAGVLRVLDRLGVPAPAKLHDGSGLSRHDRIDPAVTVALLRAVATSEPDDPLRGVLPGLPVAGFSGSLALRFADVPDAEKGRVRAKTGTLTGVSALAGVVVDARGVPLVFTLVADDVRLPDTLAARDALDRAAAALGGCTCTR